MIPTLDTIRFGVLPTKYERGITCVEGPHTYWDKNLKKDIPFEPKNHTIINIKELLETEFESDAHATCYTLPGQDAWPLIRKQALQDVRDHGGEIYLPMLVFDWDTEDHVPWTQPLLDDFILKFSALDSHPILGKWSAFHTTKHGARIIYLLDRNVVVEEGEQYLAYMFNQFSLAGFPVDVNCKDWTRRFRCARVLRDGVRTSKNPFFLWDDSPNILPVDSLEKLPTKTIPKLIQTQSKGRGQPAHDEVDAYLTTKTAAGNMVQSSFFKEAKKALKNTPPAPCLFQPDIPLCTTGERNDTICKYLGIAIPKLLRKIPYVTPEQVYALFHGPVSQLEQDQDWYFHTWRVLTDIWDAEVAKINEEKKASAEKEIQTFAEIQQIAEGMKVWCKAPELNNPETATEFVQRHALANIGRFFFPLGLDGYYQPFAITREQLISRIRTTYLNEILPTKVLGAQGQMISMPVTDIQNEYSTPVETVEMRPQFEFEGIIEDMDGCHPTMVSPMYRRNPHLVPEYSPDVDEWLTYFLPNYELGKMWIANALAFEEGAICALSIAGPPGTGKKLLTMGLAECLEKPYTATGASISGTWNEELSKTPFLVINEALPKKQGSMAFSELFKSLTAADPITVQERFKPNVQVFNPMRIIFTANNHDIVMDLVKGKELTPDDRQAVGERLLHFDQDSAGAEFLKEKGEFLFTAREGHRWIANGVQPSDYVVAKHFLYLHQERVESEHKRRYLVEGNCHGGSTTLHKATTAKESTADVGHAIIQMVENPTKYRTSFNVNAETGALYFTINNIRMFITTMMEKTMTFHACSQALRNIEINKPTVYGDIEWHEIDCRVLLDQAKEWGIEAANIRAMVMKQYETGYLK